MRKLTERKKDIEGLAVAYQAYCEAVTERDDSGISCWGGMLLDYQARLGVELRRPDTLRWLVKEAQQRIAWAKEIRDAALDAEYGEVM